MDNINTAIIERLERVVETLQENSVKMGQLLAVHNEKLDKQDKVDEVLFEKVDNLHSSLKRENKYFFNQKGDIEFGMRVRNLDILW